MPVVVVGRAARARRAGGAHLRPAAGPRLAADLLQRHHRRRPRGARRQRARGAGGRRRAGGGRRPRRVLAAAARRRARSARAFGTFVHSVLEATDFAADELTAELAARVGEVQARRQVDIGEPALIVAGLRGGDRDAAGRRAPAARRRARRPARRAGLRAAAGGRRRADRAARRRPRSPRSCASTCRPAIRSPATRERLEDPALRPSVRGYLTGSIDLVMRIRRPLRDRRLQDQLARPARRAADRLPLPPAALAAEMEPPTTRCRRCSTPSRCTATWAGACPATTRAHLAGVYYLFLRGMTGGAGGGVFAWHPPGALVEALSEALA